MHTVATLLCSLFLSNVLFTDAFWLHCNSVEEEAYEEAEEEAPKDEAEI